MLYTHSLHVPSQTEAVPAQRTSFVPSTLSHVLAMDPFSIYPLLHCKRQTLPNTLPHTPDISLPFSGGMKNGHLRTQKKFLDFIFMTNIQTLMNCHFKPLYTCSRNCSKKKKLKCIVHFNISPPFHFILFFNCNIRNGIVP